MLKQNCVVKYMDKFGIEHAVKVEAGTLFEAAILGLQRLNSSFGAEIWDRMSITVEISAEPTTYAAMVQKLKPWIQSDVSRPQKEESPERFPLRSKNGTKSSKSGPPSARAKASAVQFRGLYGEALLPRAGFPPAPWNAR